MKHALLLASLTLFGSLAQAEPAQLAATDMGEITAGYAAPPVNVDVNVGFPNIAIATAAETNVASGVQVPTALSVFDQAGVQATLQAGIIDFTAVGAIGKLGTD